MSTLHIRHIEAHLLATYPGLADQTEAKKNTSFLSAALAAFSVQICTMCDAASAADSVTDGYNDNGIDALYIDAPNRAIYIVQSKWSSAGTSTVSLGDMHKFVAGVRDLLQLSRERFSNKFESAFDALPAVLDSTDCRVEMIVAHTSVHGVSDKCKEPIDDLLKEFNDISEVIFYKEISQREFHGAASRALNGSPISIEVTLQEWGRIEEPYSAFYGQLSAESVGEWWSKYRSNIFASNIRQFIALSPINRAISDTLLEAPQDFWYMNNGVTLLCESIEKKLLGGAERGIGYFSCHGVSVINGAQTVGAIGRVLESNLDDTDRSRTIRAKVMVRLISLEKCPEDFSTRVTISTNTQNRVQNRDFAALDPEQQRLGRELQFERIEYTFKVGVALPSPDRGFTIEDATIARACALGDLHMAVMAKSTLGLLWDQGKPHYRHIFSSDLTGPQLWQDVKVHYIVEHALRGMRDIPKLRNVAYHGNRFILYQTFTILRAKSTSGQPEVDVAHIAESVAHQCVLYLDRSSSYAPAFFKNFESCRNLEAALELTQVEIRLAPFDDQFQRAARAHPNFRVQVPLFEDEGDVLT